MEKDTIYWNDDFRNSLSKYCCELFIDTILHYYEEKERIFQTKGAICWIDITNFIRAEDGINVIDKVKFCVAWLNTLSYNGVVHIDDKDFNYMHHTDFTSYMQFIGIITQEEQNEINKDWIDITNGEPYYCFP